MNERGKPMALRSLMFCPANRPDMIAKLARYGADGVVLDLEDAVPAGAKSEARAMAGEGAATLAGANPSLRVFIRVNAVGSPWIEHDIAHGLLPSIAGIVVPKVETAEDIDEAARLLDAAGLGHVGILAGWETAAGVENATRAAHPRLLAAYWGAEDYIADVGGQRTDSGHEVAYARSRAVMAARIIDVPILDQVVVDVTDDDRFRAEAAQARQLGYSGKLCLHPAQVRLANEAFTPSQAEVDWCRRLLAAAADAEREGKGVVLFEGSMVDMPVIRQAERLMALAHLGERSEA